MTMDELYKRRIRIESPSDKLTGRSIHVTDLETGEEITNISSMRIYLSARGMSHAKVTYYKYENGKIATKDGDPIIKTNTLDNPEIAISALEQFGGDEL